MDWVQQQLDDEALFPSAIGAFAPVFFRNTHKHARAIRSRVPQGFSGARAQHLQTPFSVHATSPCPPHCPCLHTFSFSLLSVYGHIYHRHHPLPSSPFPPLCVTSGPAPRSHLDAVVALEIEPHLNTCFRHFMSACAHCSILPMPYDVWRKVANFAPEIDFTDMTCTTRARSYYFYNRRLFVREFKLVDKKVTRLRRRAFAARASAAG
jgi:hypothetical protein